MKAYELIKKINNGEIKEGTQIRVYCKSYNADYWFWGNWFGTKDGYTKMDNMELYLCDNSCRFEIIEEDKPIEKLKIAFLDNYEPNEIDRKCWNRLNEHQDKINEIIEEVNKLNKECDK